VWSGGSSDTTGGGTVGTGGGLGAGGTGVGFPPQPTRATSHQEARRLGLATAIASREGLLALAALVIPTSPGAAAIGVRGRTALVVLGRFRVFPEPANGELPAKRGVDLEGGARPLGRTAFGGATVGAPRHAANTIALFASAGRHARSAAPTVCIRRRLAGLAPQGAGSALLARPTLLAALGGGRDADPVLIRHALPFRHADRPIGAVWIGGDDALTFEGHAGVRGRPAVE